MTQEEYDKLVYIVHRQVVFNGWFTKESVQKALLDWSDMLTEEQLTTWTSKYAVSPTNKRIAVIMAGNIPLVGFHDFITVLLSEHTVIAKLSSEDETLLPAFVDVLIQWNPSIAKRIELSKGRMANIEAVIATGSNNSMQYFEKYFGKHPHIFRKNRTSIAVLTGKETQDELKRLGEDIFTYYGLGCRNVTHLLFPVGYELSTFFEGIFDFKEVIFHKKYGNNYDYNKAVHLLNKHNLFDNNFVLLNESEALFCPLAMLHYHYYANESEVENYISQNRESIQAIVGTNYIPFGEAQKPALSDYADNIDTMEFLSKI